MTVVLFLLLPGEFLDQRNMFRKDWVVFHIKHAHKLSACPRSFKEQKSVADNPEYTWQVCSTSLLLWRLTPLDFEPDVVSPELVCNQPDAPDANCHGDD